MFNQYELDAIERNTITKPVRLQELRDALTPLNETMREYSPTVNSALSRISKEYDNWEDEMRERFWFTMREKYTPNETKKRRLYEYIREVRKRKPHGHTAQGRQLLQEQARLALQKIHHLNPYKFKSMELDEYGDILHPMQWMIRVSTS
jgi:hypothetical protein